MSGSAGSRPIGHLGWEAPRPWGVVVDAAAPGGGESLSGAAAVSANRKAKGRGPSQSRSGDGPRRDRGPSSARGWVGPGLGGAFASAS